MVLDAGETIRAVTGLSCCGEANGSEDKGEKREGVLLKVFFFNFKEREREHG